jgi:hypothetical protein
MTKSPSFIENLTIYTVNVKLNRHPLASKHFFAEATPFCLRTQADMDLEQLLDGVIIDLSSYRHRNWSCHNGKIEEIRTGHMEGRSGVTQEIAALDSISRGREPDTPRREIQEVIDIRELG